MYDAPHPPLDRLCRPLAIRARGPGTAERPWGLAFSDGSGRQALRAGRQATRAPLRHCGQGRSSRGRCPRTPGATLHGRDGVPITHRIHPPAFASRQRLGHLPAPSAVFGTEAVPMNFWVSRRVTLPATPSHRWMADNPLSCLERTDHSADQPPVGSNEPDDPAGCRLDQRT